MKAKPKYLPFLSGCYSTLPGLALLDKAVNEDRLVFQVDQEYQQYVQNKFDCRTENIHKYFKEFEFRFNTKSAINNFILNQLLKEHPGHFDFSNNILTNGLSRIELDLESPHYESRFDLLCSQLQEDIAVVQMTDDSEYLSAIHLCAPNHWSPADKIGRSFASIHSPVADMEHTIRHYRPMLKSIVDRQGTFYRFAWGIGTDNRLNHHPVPPLGWSQDEWEGRSISNPEKFYARVERQTLTGFPEVKAFLFTIRTYFYDVDGLDPTEKQKLLESLEGMSEASRRYKGLIELLPGLVGRLRES